jgi:hypothetical protein
MRNASTQDQPLVIVLADEDNVCVACQRIESGQTIVAKGESFPVIETVLLGHKVARRDIAEGAEIIKYGAAVGVATQAIRRGEHVHVQNMKSTYLPTYTLDGENPYIGRVS